MKNISLDLAFEFVNQYRQILPNEQFTLLTFIKLLGTNYKNSIQIAAPEIAEITGFKSRTIQRHVAKLKLRKIIIIERSFKGGGAFCGPNIYTVVGWADWVEKHGR